MGDSFQHDTSLWHEAIKTFWDEMEAQLVLDLPHALAAEWEQTPAALASRMDNNNKSIKVGLF